MNEIYGAFDNLVQQQPPGDVNKGTKVAFVLTEKVARFKVFRLRHKPDTDLGCYAEIGLGKNTIKIWACAVFKEMCCPGTFIMAKPCS